MSKKILIIGGSGSLALKLAKYFQSKNEQVYSFSRSKPENTKVYCDYVQSDYSANHLQNYIMTICPDLIVSTVACTNVELCQSNVEIAYQSNIETSLALRDAIVNLRIMAPYVVHISTDHVYSRTGFSSEGCVDCVNQYASSKLFGEYPFKQMSASVFRTSFMTLSPKKNNFINWMFDSFRSNGGSANLYDNVLFNATTPEAIGHNVLQAYGKRVNGTFNIGAIGHWSKADFYVKIMEKCNLSLDYQITNYPDGLVPRPLDMRMDVSKALSYGFDLLTTAEVEKFVTREILNAFPAR